MASLPKPKQTDWELELPEEQPEINGNGELSEEDAAERDRRNQIQREVAERADFKRRTQVLQRNLPRPPIIDADTLLEDAANIVDPVERAVAKEMALLVINDALKYPDPDAPTKVNGASRPLEIFNDNQLNQARLEIALEMPPSGQEERRQLFEKNWLEIHNASLPGLQNYGESEIDPEKQQIIAKTNNVSPEFPTIFPFTPNTNVVVLEPSTSTPPFSQPPPPATRSRRSSPYIMAGTTREPSF